MDFCNAIDDSKYNGKIGASERHMAEITLIQQV